MQMIFVMDGLLGRDGGPAFKHVNAQQERILMIDRGTVFCQILKRLHSNEKIK